MKFIKFFFLILFFVSCSKTDKAVIIWNLNKASNYFLEGEEVLVKNAKDKNYLIIYKYAKNKTEKNKIIKKELDKRLLDIGFQVSEKEKKGIVGSIKNEFFKSGVKVSKDEVVLQRESTLIPYKRLFKNFEGFLDEYKIHHDRVASFDRNVFLYQKADEKSKLLKQIFAYRPMKILYEKSKNWYYVALKTGEKGFVKAYDINIKHYQSDLQLSKMQREDILLNISGINWRSVKFANNIKNRRYDFHYFNPNYKFFINYKAKFVILLDENHSFYFYFKNFKYDPRTFVYYFFVNGLKVFLKNKDTIEVSFRKNSQNYFYTFVKVEKSDREIDYIYKRDLARRRDILNSLLDKNGNTASYNSIKYGYLEIFNNARFVWSDFQKLYPKEVSFLKSNEGHIEFNNYISMLYEDYYDGAFTFIFDNGRKIDFLYKIKKVKKQKMLKETLFLSPVISVKDNLITKASKLKLEFAKGE